MMLIYYLLTKLISFVLVCETEDRSCVLDMLSTG